MEFKSVKESDYSLICSFLKNSPYTTCDYSCGAFILWHRHYHAEYAIHDGFLYVRDNGSTVSYALPMGKGNWAQAVRALEPLATDGHLRFHTIPVEGALRLQSMYGNAMTYRFDRDDADYIYNAQSMVSFAGKKMSTMRNHLNRFQKEHPNYRFVAVNHDNLDCLADFFARINKIRDLSSAEAKAEEQAIPVLLRHLDCMDWCAGMIELDGRVVAASVGEYKRNCLIIHVEKADTTYSGCYQVMVNEFAKAFVKPGIAIINREDDMGLEGLRKSKLAYRPIRLLDKANVDILLGV